MSLNFRLPIGRAIVVFDGIVIREKVDRRSVFTVVQDAPFDDGLISVMSIGHLLDLVVRVQ